MNKNLVLYTFLLFPFLGNCQNFNMENMYGYYIGISLSNIKNKFEIKHYMVLALEKNFYAINFNQLGDQKTMAYSDDIIGLKWDYKCTAKVLSNNHLQIQSKNFYFNLKMIDSLTLKIEGSTYLQYIGDTLYRVSARRYNGDLLDNGWAYLPYYNQNGAEEIYVLNSYLDYPQAPVWYYYNLEANRRIYIPDSLYFHPLTKKIRSRIK